MVILTQIHFHNCFSLCVCVHLYIYIADLSIIHCLNSEVYHCILKIYHYNHEISKKFVIKNKWIAECKNEEFKSSQMWQAKVSLHEVQGVYTQNKCESSCDKSKRKKRRLAKTESKQMENTGCEVLADSIKIN